MQLQPFKLLHFCMHTQPPSSPQNHSPSPSLSYSLRVNLLKVAQRPTSQWLVSRSSFVLSAQDTRGKASCTPSLLMAKRLIRVTKHSSSTLKASKLQSDNAPTVHPLYDSQNLVFHLKAFQAEMSFTFWHRQCVHFLVCCIYM